MSKLEDELTIKKIIDGLRKERNCNLKNISRLQSRACQVQTDEKCDTMEDSLLKSMIAVINKHYNCFDQSCVGEAVANAAWNFCNDTACNTIMKHS